MDGGDMSKVSSMGSCNDIYASAIDITPSASRSNGDGADKSEQVLGRAVATTTKTDADATPAVAPVTAATSFGPSTDNDDANDHRASIKRATEDHAQLVKRLSKQLVSTTITFNSKWNTEAQTFNAYMEKQYPGLKLNGIGYLTLVDSEDSTKREGAQATAKSYESCNLGGESAHVIANRHLFNALI